MHTYNLSIILHIYYIYYICESYLICILHFRVLFFSYKIFVIYIIQLFLQYYSDISQSSAEVLGAGQSLILLRVVECLGGEKHGNFNNRRIHPSVLCCCEFLFPKLSLACMRCLQKGTLYGCAWLVGLSEGINSFLSGEHMEPKERRKIYWLKNN